MAKRKVKSTRTKAAAAGIQNKASAERRNPITFSSSSSSSSSTRPVESLFDHKERGAYPRVESLENYENYGLVTIWEKVDKFTLTPNLCKLLTKIMAWLDSYDEVGVDANNKRSAQKALTRVDKLSDMAYDALKLAIWLPQTNLTTELQTTIQIVIQKLDVARVQINHIIRPHKAIEYDKDQAIIRCVRKAFLESYQQVGRSLNRLAAELAMTEYRDVASAASATRGSGSPYSGRYWAGRG